MFDAYDSVTLGKYMVAFQNGLDSCEMGSSIYAYYREMVVGIAKELKARYIFESKMLEKNILRLDKQSTDI